jgi:hypothetical protein
MEIIIALLTAAVVIGVMFLIVKIWNSWLFWVATLAITVVLFPMTSGMSAGLFGVLLFARIFILIQILRKA